MYIWNEKDFSDMTQVEVEMGCMYCISLLTHRKLPCPPSTIKKIHIPWTLA